MNTGSKLSQAPPSLTRTIAIAFFALSVVVILISGALLVLAYVQTQRESIVNNLELVAQDAAKEVSGFLQDKIGALETLATFSYPVTWYQAENTSNLESLLGIEPAFRQLIIVRDDGLDVAHISRVSATLSPDFTRQLTPETYAQIKQGKTVISSVYVDSATNEPIVSLAVPIKDALGDVQGTLAAEVSLKTMWALVDQLKVGESGVVYVVDRNGDLLAYKDTGRVLRHENVQDLYHVREFVGAPRTISPDWLGLVPGIENVPVVGSVVSLGSPDWAVVTEIPGIEAYRRVLATIGTSVVIILVVAFLAGFVGLFLARRLAVSLVNLTHIATRISEGELGLRAEIAGPLEVVELASAFNRMTARLRQTLEGLEQRVVDRTRDLAESKDELEKANVELQSNSSYLAALNETSLGLMSRLDTNELLAAIVARAAALVNTDSGYIYLTDPGTPYIQLRVGTGLYEGLVGARIKQGEGLAGTVWQSGELLAIADYQNWSGRLHGSQRQNIHAAVGVPLQSRQGVIGVIGLAYDQPGQKFGENEVSILNRFGQLAIIALENARLFEQTQSAYDETERQAKALARLNQGSTEMVSAKTVSEIVRIADETVSDVLLPDRVSLAMLLPDGETVEVFGVQGEAGAAPVGTRMPLSGTMIADALKAKRALYSGDVTQNYNNPGGMAVMINQGIRSIINAPLLSGEHALGSLNVSSKTVNRFTDRDINFVVQVASMAGTALENLRLLEQTQNALNKAELMYRATRDLSDALDLNHLLKVAAEFGQAFGFSSVSLSFSDTGIQDLSETGYDIHVGMIRNNRFFAPPSVHLQAEWNVPSEAYVAVEGQHVLIVPDVSKSPLVQAGQALQDLPTAGVRTFYGLLLESSHNRFGFLGFGSPQLVEPMSEEHLRSLVAFGNQFKTALENRRLYEQTQAALAEAQRLAELERESADQVNALNRRLTGQGWQDYLMQQRESVWAEDAQYSGNGSRTEIPELARAAETGEMVISKENGHSRLAVPIVVRGEVIGTIGLEDLDPQQEWSPDRIGIVNDVVQNLGLALDNARLYTQSQRRISELDALNRISQAVTTKLDLESLLTVIGDQVCEIFDVQNVYVALYNSKTQRITMPYFMNDNKRIAVDPIRFGEGITAEIIRTQAPLVLNYSNDSRMAELGAKVYGNPAKSFLGVPIMVGDDVTGVISIQDMTREGAFDESSIRVLKTVAASIGAAIQNAQLYGAMQQEVMVRQQAEEEIKLSLKEKEVLLKEIHHRVKNNLQIITSLLNLQSAQIKDPEAFTMFRESQARVRSMALIHEKLYQSKDLARIDFDGYVRDLMVYLFRSYAANPDQIRTEIDTSNMFLGIDTAIPCGLIISELVTNSMKYAFPNGQRGKIYIGLHPHQDGTMTLDVTDDGVGFREGFDWRESDSLGLQLVSTLISQLHGKMQVSGTNGTSFKLTFTAI